MRTEVKKKTFNKIIVVELQALLQKVEDTENVSTAGRRFALRPDGSGFRMVIQFSAGWCLQVLLLRRPILTLGAGTPPSGVVRCPRDYIIGEAHGAEPAPKSLQEELYCHPRLLKFIEGKECPLYCSGGKGTYRKLNSCHLPPCVSFPKEAGATCLFCELG